MTNPYQQQQYQHTNQSELITKKGKTSENNNSTWSMSGIVGGSGSAGGSLMQISESLTDILNFDFKNIGGSGTSGVEIVSPKEMKANQGLYQNSSGSS